MKKYKQKSFNLENDLEMELLLDSKYSVEQHSCLLSYLELLLFSKQLQRKYSFTF